jgi:chemotaxis family two-component system sensor kinase Cph1
MGSLIDDLLAFSRLSRTSLQAQLIDMQKLVKECLADLEWQTQDRNIDMRVSELSPGFGDVSLLKQVWFYLLSNALKYTRGKHTPQSSKSAVSGITEKLFISLVTTA